MSEGIENICQKKWIVNVKNRKTIIIIIIYKSKLQPQAKLHKYQINQSYPPHPASIGSPTGGAAVVMVRGTGGVMRRSADGFNAGRWGSQVQLHNAITDWMSFNITMFSIV